VSGLKVRPSLQVVPFSLLLTLIALATINGKVPPLSGLQDRSEIVLPDSKMIMTATFGLEHGPVSITLHSQDPKLIIQVVLVVIYLPEQTALRQTPPILNYHQFI
jgi:hypothetical protein